MMVYSTICLMILIMYYEFYYSFIYKWLKLKKTGFLGSKNYFCFGIEGVFAKCPFTRLVWSQVTAGNGCRNMWPPWWMEVTDHEDWFLALTNEDAKVAHILGYWPSSLYGASGSNKIQWYAGIQMHAWSRQCLWKFRMSTVFGPWLEGNFLSPPFNWLFVYE
jgi:hypothetical protein